MGSRIKVDPIINLEDIAKIKNLIKNNPRNYCLFILGINTNLRAVDLCQIKVGQVRGLKENDEIELREQIAGMTTDLGEQEDQVDDLSDSMNDLGKAEEKPLLTIPTKVKKRLDAMNKGMKVEVGGVQSVDSALSAVANSNTDVKVKIEVVTDKDTGAKVVAFDKKGNAGVRIDVNGQLGKMLEGVGVGF